MLRFCSTLIVVLFLVSTVRAVDHKLEPLDEAFPADAVSEEIGKQLGNKGLRVVRGAARTVCDLWLCKEWAAAEAKPSGDVIYPFQPGQLIGLARFPRKASDFRDQDIAEGVYTLRYGQQPVDGAHVGTSPTRDFLLLIKADQDKSPAPPDYKQLTKASAQAAGSNHPLLLSLQRLAPTTTSAPAIRHDEAHEWWIVALSGQLKQGAATKPQLLELVVVGKAAE
jgi:hypothetical protein